MPSEGRAILSQIEGLCEQFLALDYDTPVKADVEEMLDGVRSGMQALESEDAEGVAPEAGMAPGEEEGNPLEGLLEGVEEEAEEEPPTEEEPPSDFRGARESALKNVKKTGQYGRPDKGKASDEVPPEEDERRKRRKAKAGRR